MTGRDKGIIQSELKWIEEFPIFQLCHKSAIHWYRKIHALRELRIFVFNNIITR
ncbi:uncharacterized protein METZ01_LOCUS81777 [marine metagenome]|uniref:Uncharacterized protein n=1 Tax=marine metagenome TaxID=408172 RepID=A0A381UQ19_9ZZZZ